MERRIPYSDYLYPKVSIIIPTLNHSSGIAMTLKSIMGQVYPDLEVIVVDAGSKDRTLEVVNSYLDERIKIYSSSEYHFYEMLNKGITLSSGEYLTFLAPGRFYLSVDTIKKAMDLVLEGALPSLVYGASLVRFGSNEPHIFRNEFTLDNLKRGLPPSSLSSCFFHNSLFDALGKFDTHYLLQGDFDFFCRFALSADSSIKTTTQVFSDEDQRTESRKRLLIHFKETMRIVRKYFGLQVALNWLLTQEDLGHYFTLLLHNLRRAFLGR